MKRRLVTIHPAVKAQEMAKLLEYLAEAYDDPTVESRADGVVIYTNNWDRRAHR